MSGRIVRLFASIPATIKELGFRNAAFYWSDRILAGCSFGVIRLRRYLFVVQALDAGAAHKPTSEGKTSSVRPLVSDDLGRFSFPVPIKEIQRRIDQGSICLVAESNGQFAGYIWLHTGPYPEDEVRCIFEPWPEQQVSWDFDVYVEPRFRATRTFVRLWQAAGRYLIARGFSHSASRISTYNAASLRAHMRSGAIVLGSAVFINIGRRQITIAPGGIPKALYFKSDPEPRLRICLPAAGQ